MQILRLSGIILVLSACLACGGGDGISDQELRAAAMTFANEFWAGDLDAAYGKLEAKLRNQLSFGQFSELRRSAVEADGALQQIGDITVSRESDFYVVDVESILETNTVILRLTFNDDLLIAGIFFDEM